MHLGLQYYELPNMAITTLATQLTKGRFCYACGQWGHKV